MHLSRRDVTWWSLHVRPEMGAFRSAFADEQQTYTLQQFYRRVHSFGQENVGASFALVNFYFAGEKNRRCFRGDVLDAFDQLGAVDAWHDQVCQHQIYSSLSESLQRLLCVGERQHTVASGFQHYFSNGEGLLIIVNTENSSFWFHGPFHKARKNCSA